MKLSFFQIAILILGTLFLILCFHNRDIGRYQMIDTAGMVKVIDTKTGRYYTAVQSGNWVGSDFDLMYHKAAEFWEKSK